MSTIFDEDSMETAGKTTRSVSVDPDGKQYPLPTETEYQHIVTSQPLDEALHTYFELRAAR